MKYFTGNDLSNNIAHVQGTKKKIKRLNYETQTCRKNSNSTYGNFKIFFFCYIIPTYILCTILHNERWGTDIYFYPMNLEIILLKICLLSVGTVIMLTFTLLVLLPTSITIFESFWLGIFIIRPLLFNGYLKIRYYF